MSKKEAKMMAVALALLIYGIPAAQAANGGKEVNFPPPPPPPSKSSSSFSGVVIPVPPGDSGGRTGYGGFKGHSGDVHYQGSGSTYRGGGYEIKGSVTFPIPGS